MYIKRTDFSLNTAVWVFYSYFWQSGSSYEIQCTHRPLSAHRSWVQRSVSKFQNTACYTVSYDSDLQAFSLFYFLTVFETFLNSWWQWLCISLRHSQTLANLCGNWKILQPKPRKEKIFKKIIKREEKREWHRPQTMNNYSNTLQIQEVLIPQ